MKYEIIKKERAYDGFFKIDKYTIKHETFAGGKYIEKNVEVFERGDACAALIYEKDTDSLLFIRQFRTPVTVKDGGWITELVAGKVEPEEKPIETMRREIAEEIGYDITELKPIFQFYISPGGTTEIMFLFYAETDSALKTYEGGGLANEGEDIQLVKIPVSEIKDKLHEIIDAKTLIGVQWFLLKEGR